MLVLPQGPLHCKETNASLSIWGFGDGGGFFFQVFISKYMEVRGQLGRSQLSPFSIWVSDLAARALTQSPFSGPFENCSSSLIFPMENVSKVQCHKMEDDLIINLY